MPRIRTIKPEFFQDEKMAPLSPIDRFVFLGLISMADDAGRLLDNVKVIDAFIFPDTDHSARESLMKLSGIARIRRGTTASGQRVIQIANWERHQRVQHPQLAAALPELVADAEDTDDHEPLMNDSGGAHEPLAPRTYDLRPTINDQRPTTKNTRRMRAGAHDDPLFDAAWSSYPKREGGNPRRGAFRAWRARVADGVPAAELAAGVERYRAYCVARDMVGTRFVMQGARFFGPDRNYADAWDVAPPPDPLEARAKALLAEQAERERADAAWLANRPTGLAS